MLHKKKHLIVSAITSGLLTISAPTYSDVVTSIKPLGFIAAAIADGVTPVDVLLPDGASEHDYALRPSDIKRMQGADLVVWIGPEMETFMTKTVSSLAEKNRLEVAALPTVKPLLHAGGHTHEHDHDHDESEEKHHHSNGYDLHVWLSPEIAERSAVAIHAKLLELIPRKKKRLDDNLRQFKAELAKANQTIASRLEPVKGKGYFVFHDAYGYFEKHYGLQSLGHFTVNPTIQPGAKRLNQIRIQLVEHKAECVFAEPQFRPAIIDAVARGTDVRKGVLDPLGAEISLARDSYVKFLSLLSGQYVSCLKGA